MAESTSRRTCSGDLHDLLRCERSDHTIRILRTGLWSKEDRADYSAAVSAVQLPPKLPELAPRAKYLLSLLDMTTGQE